MYREKFFRNERFFNGFKHDSPFQKGDLKYIILDLIKDKPRYGYEVIRSLEENSHGFYKPSPGSVYPTLQMLEEMGYAVSKERDGKKIYEITQEGQDFLKEQSDVTDHLKSHMKRHWNPDNFETIGRIIGDVSKIKRLLRSRIRNISKEKLKQISGIISNTRQEIEKIVEE